MFVDEASDDDKEGWSNDDPSTITPNPHGQQLSPPPQHRMHDNTTTFDFVGRTLALFHNPSAARWVMILFHANACLVLGNCILVVSHAVAAMIGEECTCVPAAGILALTPMFAVSQSCTKEQEIATLAEIVGLGKHQLCHGIAKAFLKHLSPIGRSINGATEFGRLAVRLWHSCCCHNEGVKRWRQQVQGRLHKSMPLFL